MSRSGPADREAAPNLPRFIVLTSREPDTDFRVPFVAALRRRGCEVHFVRLRRPPVVLAGPTADSPPETMSLPQLVARVRHVTSGAGPVVCFNTTNLSFPVLTTLLKMVCGKAIWVLDVHDDLLYDYVGWRRLREWVKLRVLVLASDVLVHAGVKLRQQFPRSHHLGNASHLERIERNGADFSKVLIIASIDQRFDFPFLEDVLTRCPAYEFHIHGQIAAKDPAVWAEIKAFCRRHDNVFYHGPYVGGDLEQILGCYSVTLAPYVMNSVFTHYLDPLRYYHCLNSGMEVITTDIPQARALGEALHIVGSPAEAANRLIQLAASPSARLNAGDRYRRRSWDERVDRLLDILDHSAK